MSAPACPHGLPSAAECPQLATMPTLTGETLPPTVEGLGQGAIAATGYEILGELGRGGMGVVYKAKQTALNRVVALKMLLSAGHSSADALERFHTEAEAAARLAHPNIVRVYEVGTHGGLPFLCMECLDGGSLEQRLDGRPMPPADAARVMEALARAVQAAHAAGVLHRDLKPSNVLFAATGEAKITDFGLAKKLDQQGHTRTGSVMGTPSYMAPEQASASKEVGPAADVYSLGAILYECLTGRPPFQAATAMDTLLQVLADDPLPPRTVNNDVPRDLEAVCLKCLDKDPQRRYASAGDLADDLRHFLDGEPVAALRSGLIEQLAGALERVQLQASFASYGALLLWLAPVMALPEVWITLVVLLDWPSPLLALGQFGRAITFVVLVGWHRGWRWLPRGAAERQLWAVWGGYLASCFTMGLAMRFALSFFHTPGLSHELSDTRLELLFYPPLATLTALAFWTMAGNFWGYCAVIAAGFLALGFVMAVDLRWAPLEFGAAWACVLVVLGVRLRRLGQRGADL